MPRYKFAKVSATGRKSGKCGCGVRRTRSKEFWQTLNPFNKNGDGTVKNHDDISRELGAEIKRWQAEPITCSKCEGA